jgi:arylsulfatase A-like enzyme
MARPPDILWIVTTQWRAQACGYAGDPNAVTPALDALAWESVNYTEATTPHPFGPFARAALFTGVPSPENGVRDYHDPLPRGTRTIAHDLADRGYATAFFGKWHLAARDRDAPLVGEGHARQQVPRADRAGFAHWEGFEGGFQLNDPWMHGTRLPGPVRLRGYQSDVLAEWTAVWINEMSRPREAERFAPWFVCLSLEAPHPPYGARAAGVTARDPTAIILADNVPRGGEVEARARRELAGYYAHIEATDRALGRLLAAVPREVVVMFTSVHGDMHGAHGLFRKGWPHEESVRVPLLVRRGARSAPDSSPLSLLDLRALTVALAEGRDWKCPRDHAPISMPSVVALPDQCDRTWHGERRADGKRVWTADGELWLENV